MSNTGSSNKSLSRGGFSNSMMMSTSKSSNKMPSVLGNNSRLLKSNSDLLCKSAELNSDKSSSFRQSSALANKSSGSSRSFVPLNGNSVSGMSGSKSRGPSAINSSSDVYETKSSANLVSKGASASGMKNSKRKPGSKFNFRYSDNDFSSCSLTQARSVTNNSLNNYRKDSVNALQGDSSRNNHQKIHSERKTRSNHQQNSGKVKKSVDDFWRDGNKHYNGSQVPKVKDNVWYGENNPRKFTKVENSNK